MGRRFTAAILSLTPFLGGCLLPYGYPTLDVTPPVRLDPEAEQVRAFRVDQSREWGDMSGTITESLTEFSAPAGAWIAPEVKPAVTYGFYVVGVALNYPVETSHAVAVRLYRPGYELVTVGTWDTATRVTWRPVADAAGREQALDHLFPDRLGTAPDGMPAGGADHRPPRWRAGLAKGSVAPAHRQALLFGAAEYERLAERSAGDDRVRLSEKATRLRNLAAE